MPVVSGPKNRVYFTASTFVNERLHTNQGPLSRDELIAAVASKMAKGNFNTIENYVATAAHKASAESLEKNFGGTAQELGITTGQLIRALVPKDHSLFTAKGKMNVPEVLKLVADHRNVTQGELKKQIRSALPEIWANDDLAKVAGDFGGVAKELGVDPYYVLRFLAFHLDPSAKKSPSSIEKVAKHVTAQERAADAAPKSVTPFKELAELEALEGLEGPKQMMRGIAAVKYTQEAFDALGLPRHQPNTNAIIEGPPGSGKTTTGKAIAHANQALDVFGTVDENDAKVPELPGADKLPKQLKEHLPPGLEVDDGLVRSSRADLVGGYIGHTALRTQATNFIARGKTHFADEAQELYRPGADKDFGPEALAELMRHADRADSATLLAGYNLEDVRDSNPGLNRRFPYQFQLEQLKPEQLGRVLDQTLAEKGLRIGPFTRRKLMAHLGALAAGKNFGNAGEIRNMLEPAIGKQRLRAHRLLATGKGLHEIAARTLIATDFLSRELLHPTSVDESFKHLIGLEQPKSKIREVQRLVKNAERKGEDPRKRLPPIWIFEGAPGTGKTTIAEGLGQVFKGSGLLPTAEVVKTDAGKLTSDGGKSAAQKVSELLEKSRGKVLLIDEAYQLPQAVLDTLVARAEDTRSNTIIILAGYTKEMQEFRERNTGLISRTNNIFKFATFTKQNAIDAAKTHLERDKDFIEASEEAVASLGPVFERVMKAPHWSSGRDVRMLIDGAILKAVDRFEADLEARPRIGPNDPRPRELEKVLPIDLERAADELIASKKASGVPAVGF